MKLVGFLFAAAVLVVGGGVFLLGHGHRQPTVATSAEEVEVPPSVVSSPEPVAAPEPRRAPDPRASTPPQRARLPAGPTFLREDQLMTTLRDLGASDPARALNLAREGNLRFPNSADAAERSWTICKSLAALGRFSEAQDEARQAVAQYPGTTWAEDLRRHLLTQPLADPSQRGYGKSSELD